MYDCNETTVLYAQRCKDSTLPQMRNRQRKRDEMAKLTVLISDRTLFKFNDDQKTLVDFLWKQIFFYDIWF